MIWTRIEERMAEIIAEDQPFEREELSVTEALEVFADQPFKTEIIEGVDEDEGAGGAEVSVYRNRRSSTCVGDRMSRPPGGSRP